ncbi:MAG: HAD family phosphatase [Dehalococcoidales bacterium]|nr:HAD family phosphatase [Dehalococcoidales bacterium]
MPDDMKNSRTRAVIWDMDGVIVDTAEHHFNSWRYAFERQGVTFTREDFQQVFGQRNDAIISRIMAGNVTREKMDSIAQDKEENFRQTVKNDLRPLPGVIALLTTIKDNGMLSAVASSAPSENIRLILTGLGIEDCFQAVVYGDEVTEGKPSPLGFLLAGRKLGVEPRDCIVIEDAVAGVQAAKRGGMHCIAVTNTHPAEDLGDADWVVDSLEKIGLKELNSLFNGK